MDSAGVGQNHEYGDEERSEFRKNPKSLVAHAKDIEDQGALIRSKPAASATIDGASR